MNILKCIRKELNLTQAELAEKLKLGRSQIGNIEQGTRKITPRIKNDLIKELNVNPNWIETGEGDIFLEREDLNNLTQTEKEFIEKFSKLTEDNQQFIISAMERLVK